MFALLLTSCASTPTQIIGEAREPLTGDQVDVLMAKPDSAYQVIAKMQVSVQQGFDEQDRLQNTIAVLTKKAAQVGANAIVVTNVNAFTAAFNRVSTGSNFVKGASFDLYPAAFKTVQLKAYAIYIKNPL